MSATSELAHEFLKTWMPWLTAGGFLIHVYTTLRSRVTDWADKLLDNHLAHLQDSMTSLETKTDKNLELQEKQIELLTRIADK
jgi:hypothetical protein